ncbi:TadE-like protein [Fontibacillus phaseoli]|uniref:TadE-like protein n=1 Tax=Fontibacillus phaseoli TaxID=1416533 RepID=A0A369BIL9_9BACL|nr:TadE family protein [Fontibacillus phaseoli]RCX20428.1 TadE-like protein [Fontibacillus phaseoli]
MIRLLRNREGSFTLEASLVFPVIFTTILILLFFCLFIYQRMLLGQAAAVAAERSAYVWDNSKRESRTGAFAESQYDSLYWRFTDDGMLKSIFGISRQVPSDDLPLPIEGIPEDPLPLYKLYRTGKALPSGMTGTMKYENKLLLRKVEVSLSRLIPLVPLERVIGDLTQEVQAESYVVEPVEWIRTVELARYYGAKFKSDGGETMDKQEAGKALELFGK